MRAVFVGASSLTAATARLLHERDDEVVIVERDAMRIDALKEDLDCAFLHADGSKPAALRECDPARSAILFCLTGDDQTNIISALVGRSLGFERVVLKIDNPEFEHICVELGLTDIVVPSRTIARYLADIVAGQQPVEMSAMVKGDARMLSFVVHDDAGSTVGELALPDQSRVVCLYRGKEFVLPGDDYALKAGDEVVLITHGRNLARLAERWSAKDGAE
jgi:trk system potassium uptake protein TrkA